MIFIVCMRQVQSSWNERELRERLRVMGRLPALIAQHAQSLANLVVRPAATAGEVIASEVLPLAESCRLVSRRGYRVLCNRRLSMRDRAWWMGSIAVQESREPFGIVLVIGPSNYPLLLPGVQIVQALAAGNGVLVKPAPQCEVVVEHLIELCIAAGVPSGLITVLPTSPESAQAAMRAGVDKVVFTGAAETGRKIARQLAETLTPAALELSGSDAVFVLEDADLDRVAQSVAYALELNGGQSCIAPRRLYATRPTLDQLVPLLRRAVAEMQPRHIQDHSFRAARQAIDEALNQGAQVAFGQLDDMSSSRSVKPIGLVDVTSEMRVAWDDLFAPVLSLIDVVDMKAAIDQSSACRYALGAAVFGSNESAKRLAARVAVGCVTINDVLVPTADPRVSFGGWKASGYGITRGMEGLREMTRLKVVCQRRGRWLPHLTTDRDKLSEIMQAVLLMRHSRHLSARWNGLKRMLKALRR